VSQRRTLPSPLKRRSPSSGVGRSLGTTIGGRLHGRACRLTRAQVTASGTQASGPRARAGARVPGSASSLGVETDGTRQRRDGEQRSRGRTHEHHEHDDDTLDLRPDAPPLRYLAFPPRTLPSRPRSLPRDRPPWLPFCLLLPSHPHARSPPACRRPASGPPTPCLGCPQIYLAGRGAEQNQGRRWGGGPLISKHQHQEINMHPGCVCVPGLGARWVASGDLLAALGFGLGGD
jgi:hypothetical protein